MTPDDPDLARLHAHLAVYGHLVPLPARTPRLPLSLGQRLHGAVRRLIGLDRGDRP